MLWSLGCFCILIGLLANVWIVAALFSSDGDITSNTNQTLIIVGQLLIISIGIYLVAKRPCLSWRFFRKTGINLLLSFISIILSLTAAELVLRQFIPLKTNKINQRLYRIPHPVLGWTLKPGASYENHLFESTAHVTYNSLGWRDSEHSIHKPDYVFRILILGDSFMEAYTVDFKQSFASLLQSNLSEKGHKVEVINMGVSGYGTLQEYQVFERYGRHYQPDLVLLAFNVMNDVQNNSPELNQVGKLPLLDPQQSNQWQIIPVDFKNIQDDFQKGKIKQQNEITKLTNQSVLLHLAKKVIRPPQLWGETVSLSLYGVSYCEEPLVYTRAWLTTQHILVQLAKRIHSTGAQFVVFTVPALWEVDQQSMQKTLSRTSQPDKICLEQAPGNARLKRILAEHNIDLIDLLPSFRHANRNQHIQLYPVDDGHWNASGHALAAKLIVAGLLESGRLRANETPYLH